MQKRVDDFVKNQKDKKNITIKELREQRAKADKEQKKPTTANHEGSQKPEDEKDKLSSDVFLKEALDILSDYLGLLPADKKTRVATWNS